nr:putative glycoside hydrolase [uncultured Oscillibacter sp.]
MVGTKGYSSYRGRGPRWKILLAFVLVLVIAAAASVIYLQQFLVYGADGSRQIRLPWQTEEKEPSPDGEGEDPANQPKVDVVVQEPEVPKPEETTAFSLPAQALTEALWQQALAAKPAGANAVAVRLKTSNGTVYFNAAGAVSGAVETELDTAAALAAVTAQEELYTIASLACLQDFKAANADVEGRGLKNTGGYIFYDGNNSLWLDPAKPSAREYVCALAKEIAELGFDELLLTDFGYPTVGKINKINYNTELSLTDNLDLLLSDLNTALEPYDILLSVEVPEAVVSEGPDAVSGLDLNRLVSRVDRIYAATTPEKAETLSNLVSQAAGEDGTTEFVPELAADSPTLTGSRLILAE